MKMALPALTALFILSACGTTASKPVAITGLGSIAGLEHIMGRDRAALVSLFGEPDLDIRESSARKYQFASPNICVLDTYLYPPTLGAVPVVTHVEARNFKGDNFDRASCVAAMSRRKSSAR